MLSSKKGAIAPVLSLTLLASVFSLSCADAAQIVVVNANSAGVGFNDTTAATPVGGNTGTTVGQQRLIAFQFAADHWGQRVASAVPIRVNAQFSALSCNQTSAVLGSAGPYTFYRDFTNAPVAGTWYSIAQANSFYGSDIDPSNDDIIANFNANIGTSGCLQSLGWYYGLDGKNPAGTLDFVTVLIHEMGHGLGFLTLVDLTTGAKALGYNDTYMLNLENHVGSPSDFPSMTDAQRAAAQINTGNLHWTGANVQAAANFLTAGAVGTHVRMYAPNPTQAGSSTSHFDTALTPDQIMEPSYTTALHMQNLERPLFRDIGWKLIQPRLDFDGESKSGILWRNNSSGDVVVSLMKGPGIQTNPSIGSTTLAGTVAPSWSVATTGDFNGDGKADILWRNNSTGDNVVSLMNGAAFSSFVNIGPVSSAYSVVGAGDFDGNGRSDIVWRNSTTGDTAISLMTGTPTSTSIALTASIGVISSSWIVAGIGDFNGDGKADILWRNTSTGDNVVFLMSGTSILSAAVVSNVPTTWSVAGVGDFNGDGKADILWRNNSTGSLVVSTMNGLLVSSSTAIGSAPTSYTVAQVGHFGNDGKAGILWRNTTTGDVVVSLSNGTSLTSTTLVATIPTAYTASGANGN